MRHEIEHAAAIAGFRLLGGMPGPLARGVGIGLARLAYSPFGVRTDVVTRQIASAFPDRTDRWVRDTARACYVHFGREAVEIVRLTAGGTRDLMSRTVGADEARETFRAGDVPGLGAVIVTGHLGNWEAAGCVVASLGMPLAAVVKRQSNPGFDRLLVDSRRRMGIETVYMEDASRRLPELIRSGVSVALVADQDALNRGLFVPFLGRPASTFRGPARLALSTGAPLYFGAAIREGNGYRGILEPVRGNAVADDPELDLTRRWVARLESWVRRHPEQYFWFHRRWKTQPPGPVEGAERETPVQGTQPEPTRSADDGHGRSARQERRTT